MKKNKIACRHIFFALTFFAAAVPSVSAAPRDIYLKLTAHGQRLDLGVSEFVVGRGGSVEDAKTARQARSVARDDLVFTRMFNIVEGGPSYTGKPDELKYWEKIGADILLCGEFRVEATGHYIVARLMDVEGKGEIWSKEFQFDKKESPRKMAHSIADEVVLRLSGERGIASTKIVFSNDAQGSKEIYVIDYDGYGLIRLTTDRSIALLPKFSPDGKEIIYTTYRMGNPDLYAINTENMERRAVSTTQGLNTAASFSPDSSQIVLTQSRGESPNLYLLKRDGNFIRRLTRFSGIDTSPSYSPTGNDIAFISNRAGYPQLYIMSAEGTNFRRVSTRGFCDSPAWSPRGDRIAFTMYADGKHNIFVYDVSGGKISQLTSGEGNDENPSWSPDGRYIVFTSTRNGRKELFRMFADGASQSRVADIPGKCHTPHWSPRLY